MLVRYIKLIAMVGFLISIYPSTSFAQFTDLRGQVVSYNPYYGDYVPAANVRVDLYHFDHYHKRWHIVTTRYTDRFGMYYMFNIEHGEYYLQVDGVNYPLPVEPIDRRIYRFQDIPRIAVR